MKLQPTIVYRVYITTNNDDIIENIIFKLKRKYDESKVVLKKSRNVRNFIYIEIETPRTCSKEELKRVFEEGGIERVKIDVVELKKPS